ncbi:succinyl-diaminopimelate desuccinylase [Altererythrobacter fulvus]|uniref:succinyl-diaminopimelate desuccinylase n=1 Tax=Caenibius fulvus TaxID=2126012 RepID=UPI003016710C
MTEPSANVVDLAAALIACPSVTPATGAVFDCLEAMLEPLGFAVHRFIAGEPPAGPVENLFAIRKGPEGSKHFAFAGHVDVVPAGEGWTGDPFTPEVRAMPGGDLLYGRGAVDMKGAVAAMIAALHDIPADAGTVSLIITGDEEGEAMHGTRALIDHMRVVSEIPDLCLVGEPTSVNRLGDMMKIGRRGSINAWFEVEGREGHVAYPHLADNPIPRLVALMADLDAMELDNGNDWFQPSNLEITEITVGNPATNVIPPRASARISIRFNDTHTGADLSRRVSEIAHRHGASARPIIYGEPFLTPPGAFSQIIADAVQAETGLTPEPSTSGGTSDARFLKDLCPVIEFGLLNATMHKRDEAVAVDDLETLVRIYRRVVLAALGAC